MWLRKQGTTREVERKACKMTYECAPRRGDHPVTNMGLIGQNSRHLTGRRKPGLIGASHTEAVRGGETIFPTSPAEDGTCAVLAADDKGTMGLRNRAHQQMKEELGIDHLEGEGLGRAFHRTR